MWANQNAAVTMSTATTTAIVAAPGAGKRIAVVGLTLQVDGVTTLQLKNGSTNLTGAQPQVAGGGWVLPLGCNDPMGKNFWYVCDENAALNLTNGQAVNVGGSIIYRIITVS